MFEFLLSLLPILLIIMSRELTSCCSSCNLMAVSLEYRVIGIGDDDGYLMVSNF